MLEEEHWKMPLCSHKLQLLVLILLRTICKRSWLPWNYLQDLTDSSKDMISINIIHPFLHEIISISLSPALIMCCPLKMKSSNTTFTFSLEFTIICQDVLSKRKTRPIQKLHFQSELSTCPLTRTPIPSQWLLKCKTCSIHVSCSSAPGRGTG